MSAARTQRLLAPALGLLAACVVMLAAGAPTAAAAGCENEQERLEQGSTHLPECRAYEQVSPPEKGLANVDDAALSSYKFTIAEDGDAFAYCNATSAGAQVGAYCGSYLARRGEERWDSQIVAPPACGQDYEKEVASEGGQKRAALWGDLKYAVITQPETAECAVAPLDPVAPVPGNNLYRVSMTGVGSLYELLTPVLSADIMRSFNTLNGSFQAGSKDGERLIYRSSGNQAGEEVASGAQQLFEWNEGVVSLVSRDPANHALSGTSTVAGNPSPLFGTTGTGYGGVSLDGEVIFFQNPVNSNNFQCELPACDLYLRENATTTFKASEQECSGGVGECPEDTASDDFKWANPSGSVAVFETKAKLRNEDPNGAASSNVDLYMYRHSSNPAVDRNLWLLSQDNEPAGGTESGVLGVLGLSDSGDTVFFVASGQLVAGEPISAGPKVYRWTWNGGTPELEYLAMLDLAGDQAMWRYGGNHPRSMIERAAPNGERLLLDTVVQLQPSVDQDSTRDVYLWDAAAGLSCLSCQPNSAASKGSAEINAMTAPGVQQNAVTHSIAPIIVSDEDFGRVFFTTPDALDPARDTNGTATCPPILAAAGATVAYACQDVYEWHEGELSLISTGKSPQPSKLVGVDRSADNVFFLTRERLVGWDADNFNDVYVARIEGGFAEPEPVEAPCEGESCRGAGSTVPVQAFAASAQMAGAGNPKTQAPRRCRAGFKPRILKGKRVCQKIKKKQAKKKRGKAKQRRGEKRSGRGQR